MSRPQLINFWSFTHMAVQILNPLAAAALSLSTGNVAELPEAFEAPTTVPTNNIEIISERPVPLSGELIYQDRTPSFNVSSNPFKNAAETIWFEQQDPSKVKSGNKEDSKAAQHAGGEGSAAHTRLANWAQRNLGMGIITNPDTGRAMEQSK
jgi:hypothetical protein